MRGLRCLSDDDEPMTAAWEYLARINNDERFYCKLLTSKFESPSMINCKSQDDAREIKVASIVEQYLSGRLELGLYAIAESSGASITSTESAQYFQMIAEGGDILHFMKETLALWHTCKTRMRESQYIIKRYKWKSII